MNPVIENLLYEAGLTAQGSWDELDDYNQQAVQRLVLLVVQECCTLIEQQGYNMVPGFVMRLTVPAEVCLIQQHFGIEQ